MEKILITGASGFVGSFMCEEAHMRRYDVWAGMRTHSSRKWLQGEWLKFMTLDLTDTTVLQSQLKGFHDREGKWDVVIHVAGATKCLDSKEFDRNNYECTRNLVDSLIALDMQPRQFVYISSLSALYGSKYGQSKLKAEQYLQSLTDFPSVIMRPTGIYGPREKDYFMMVQSIKRHVDFSVGFEPQKLTFVYVKDLVGAVFAAIDHGITHRTYAVSDGETYSSSRFCELVQQELGVRYVMHITAPLWVLRIVSSVGEAIGKLRGKPSTLNNDKYKIMAQRDWTCDISPLIEETGYVPQWKLERGVKETIKWYKDEGWI